MTTLKENLEWIGAIAVFVSLLLVAYEIRQNTNAIAAQAVFDLNESAKGLLLAQAIDPELSRLVNLGDHDPEALSIEEQNRYRSHVWANLNVYESVWTYYQRGVINGDEIESWQIDFCERVTRNGYIQLMPSIVAQTSAIRKMTEELCPTDQSGESSPNKR